MDPEREQRRRRAIETLQCDPISMRIYAHFLSQSQQAGGGAFDLATAEAVPQFALRAETYQAYTKNKAKFLPLLRDALPDFSIVESRPKSILTNEEAPADDQVYVFRPKTLEEIPEPFRKSARVLPDGAGYLVTGKKDLLDALSGVIAAGDPNNPPPAPDPNKPAVVKPAKSEFSMTLAEAKNFQAYREMSEKAAAAGQTVTLTD